MKPEQQKLPGAAVESVQPRREQVLGYIVIERPFGGAHTVLEELCAAADERLVEELLRLTAQRPA